MRPLNDPVFNRKRVQYILLAISEDTGITFGRLATPSRRRSLQAWRDLAIVIALYYDYMNTREAAEAFAVSPAVIKAANMRTLGWNQEKLSQQANDLYLKSLALMG
jgi:hypothetical protein